MKFNFAVCLSILSAAQAANVLVVTQTHIATVYANGAAPSAVSSSESSAVSSAESSTESSTASSSLSSSSPSSSASPSPTVRAAAFDFGFDTTSTLAISSTLTPTSSAPTTLVSKTSSASPTATAPADDDVPVSDDDDAPASDDDTSSSDDDTSSSDDDDTPSSDDDSAGPSDSFAKAILDAHNEKRANHGVDKLTWDEELVSYAQDYADQYDCSGSLTHSGGKYGENLAVGYSDGPKALEAWYEEGENYDYSSASSFDHFTQVIWKSTTKLGCAQKDCSKNNWGKYIICSYDPAGNMVGAGKQNLKQVV